MKWLIEHIDTVILFVISGLLLVGLLCIWIGKVMYGSGGGMLHENEKKQDPE